MQEGRRDAKHIDSLARIETVAKQHKAACHERKQKNQQQVDNVHRCEIRGGNGMHCMAAHISRG